LDKQKIRICCDKCLNQFEFDISELQWKSLGTWDYIISPACPDCGGITILGEDRDSNIDVNKDSRFYEYGGM